MSQRSGCLGGSKSTWKVCWFLTHTRLPDRRRTTSSSDDVDQQSGRQRAAELGQLVVERLRLGLGAREAVEDEAVLGVVGSSRRSTIILMIRSSGTRSPRSM